MWIVLGIQVKGCKQEFQTQSFEVLGIVESAVVCPLEVCSVHAFIAVLKQRTGLVLGV